MIVLFWVREKIRKSLFWSIELNLISDPLKICFIIVTKSWNTLINNYLLLFAFPKTRCKARDFATWPTSFSISAFSASSAFNVSSVLTEAKYTVIFFSLVLESKTGLVWDSFPLKESFVLGTEADLGIAAGSAEPAPSFVGLVLVSTEAGFLPRLVVAEPNTQILHLISMIWLEN